MEQSEIAKNLIDKLKNSEEVFTLVFTYGSKTTYDPKTNTIYWCPLEGLVMSNGRSVMSPAMCLIHEMSHALQDLDGKNEKLLNAKTSEEQKKYRLALEDDTLKNYETPIAKQLGEPTRPSYYSNDGFKRMNNSRHFITTHKGSLGWINSYTVEHNKYYD